MFSVRSMVAEQLAQVMPVMARSTLAVGTEYPASWIWRTICGSATAFGSKVTAACSLAKLTRTSSTPASFFTTRSTVAAQLAQVMP